MQNSTNQSIHRGLDQIDLRRRAFRERAEHLMALADWLPPGERAMVESVFDAGMSVRNLALMSGNEPRAMQRRLRRLIRRMNSPQFREVVRRSGGWPPMRRRVARACILEGLPVRRAAEQLRLTVHAVREQLAIVRAVVNGGTEPSTKHADTQMTTA